VDVPSISGKVIGTAGDAYLAMRFWFDAGSTYSAQSSNIGQQSGTFDIARVSVVEGDATLEFDPFGQRHYQQEFAMCQRYYQIIVYQIAGYASAAAMTFQAGAMLTTQMRATGSQTVYSAGTTNNVSSTPLTNTSSYYIMNPSPTAAGPAGVFNRLIALDAEL
jgi:hypothetical protein